MIAGKSLAAPLPFDIRMTGRLVMKESGTK